MDIHCISNESDDMKVKVAKWGNSLGLRLPKAAADAAGLKAGAEVEVVVEGLLSEMDRLGPENAPETADWGPDRGAEIIEDAYSRGEISLDDILSGKSARKNAS
jgi:antitoxin MazE